MKQVYVFRYIEKMKFGRVSRFDRLRDLVVSKRNYLNGSKKFMEERG